MNPLEFYCVVSKEFDPNLPMESSRVFEVFLSEDDIKTDLDEYCICKFNFSNKDILMFVNRGLGQKITDSIRIGKTSGLILVKRVKRLWP